MNIVLQAMIGLGLKVLSESLIQDLFMFTVRKLAVSTKTKVDDELLGIVEKHLK
jgi:hypothetical protein